MRSTRTRGAVVTALLAVTALVLAGCGGGGTGADLSGGQAARSGNDINVVDPAQLRDGGDFVWPIDELPPNFNYGQLDGTLAANRDVLGATMPFLFLGDAHGVLQPNPAYLQKAEVTGTNPQVVTYTLNPNARWSDGTTFSWQDFETNWRVGNGTNPAYTVSGTTGTEDISSVARGAGENEVVVTFAKPYGDWKGLFYPLYPKAAYATPQQFNEGWVNKLPITAGPFKLDGIDQTTKTITVSRDPNWWGDKPRLSRIIFQALATDAQPEAFANGSLSFLDIGPSVSFFQRAQQVPNSTIRIAYGPNYRRIAFNGAPGSILADPALRVAVMKGINRQVITQSQIGPIIPNATPLGNHIYVQGQTGYEDHSQVIAYNPDQARKDLDALGWTLQGNVRVKDGRQLVIRDVIPTRTAVSDAESRLVQQQLGEIGVQVNIEAVPSDNFFPQHVDTGDFDLTHFSLLGTQLPVSSGTGLWTLDPKNVNQNYGRIGDDKINQLLAQANAELDPAKQIQLANEVDQELWNIGHSLQLYQRPDAVAVRNDIANFGAKGFADNDYTKIGFTR